MTAEYLGTSYTFSPTESLPSDRSLSFMEQEWIDAKIVTDDVNGTIGMYGDDNNDYWFYMQFEANVEDLWWQINTSTTYASKRFLCLIQMGGPDNVYWDSVDGQYYGKCDLHHQAKIQDCKYLLSLLQAHTGKDCPLILKKTSD